ncbi:hypothetical protein P4O66_013467 [Electrophorus voltai]|uniref:ETAA1 activator of ATR kinase n=1 Tax=Electrophorus voltai TaxID=2609070 RepID=A0AAD8Z2H5_9TELE|nr:hypothetical protein P4O66_013467 [Electrophorus voltai]
MLHEHKPRSLAGPAGNGPRAPEAQEEKAAGRRRHRGRICARIVCSTTTEDAHASAPARFMFTDKSSYSVYHNVAHVHITLHRLMLKDEKPVDKDLVLQWIGDSAIPCTPELQQPRVRRSSARRQSNVEDLMKLAKQFDINMTRQDKERDLEIWQASEAKNCEALDKLIRPVPYNSESQGTGPFARAQTPVPVQPKEISQELHAQEQELHALFDGPTQYLSGRLSPPSANCSQESRPAAASVGTRRPDCSDGTIVPKHPNEAPKPDFDDDWENDDLLDDSFVLEVTQNPELLASAPRGRVDGAARTISSKGPGSRAGCPPRLPSCGSGNSSSTYTGTFSKARCISRPGPKPYVQTGAVRPLPKPSLDPAEKAEAETSLSRAQTSPYCREQALMTVKTSEMKRETQGSGSPGAKNSGRSARASEKDQELDSLWGDGDDDDRLLYQACDDVERISASQEQQMEGTCTNLISVKSTVSTSKTRSTVDTTNFQSIGSNSRTAHPSQATEREQPVRVFARSYSIPGATSALENKQDLVGSSRQCCKLNRYRFTPVHASGVSLAKQTTGARWEARLHGSSAENSASHHSTFKRHQSDPVVLSNKVFVTIQPAVRCSAAEIERKKQEAIARRRSRLQATEKPGTAM